MYMSRLGLGFLVPSGVGFWCRSPSRCQTLIVFFSCQVVSDLGSFLLLVSRSVSDVTRFCLCQVKFSGVGHQDSIAVRCYQILFVPGKVFCCWSPSQYQMLLGFICAR